MKRTDAAHRLANVVGHIRKHLDQPLDLDRLAEQAGLSRFHFHRIFRAAIGESLAAYVRRERLQRSATALRKSGRDVTDIALEAGYETHSAFTRAFAEHFGVAPSVFRSDRSVPIVPDHALPRPRGQAMEIRVVDLPPRRLIGFRQLGSYRNAGNAFATLAAIAGERGLIRPDSEWRGLSYDDPESIAEEALRFDACLTSDGEASEPLRVIDHEGGRYATYRHTGPYQLLEHVFDQFFDAVVFSGIYDFRDSPCLEIYRNDPERVEPKELITDVYIAIL